MWRSANCPLHLRGSSAHVSHPRRPHHDGHLSEELAFLRTVSTAKTSIASLRTNGNCGLSDVSRRGAQWRMREFGSVFLWCSSLDSCRCAHPNILGLFSYYPPPPSSCVALSPYYPLFAPSSRKIQSSGHRLFSSLLLSKSPSRVVYRPLVRLPSPPIVLYRHSLVSPSSCASIISPILSSVPPASWSSFLFSHSHHSRGEPAFLFHLPAHCPLSLMTIVLSFCHPRVPCSSLAFLLPSRSLAPSQPSSPSCPLALGWWA